MGLPQPLPGDIRHIILDRDGVLNREARGHGYILRPEDFEWLPGSLEALVMLSGLGMHISVASNQSAVGRGLMTPQQLERVLATMRTQAAAAGARIDAIYVCSHAPEAHCDCRKPAPGLIRSAVQESGIAAGETMLVGDDVRDVEAARAAGVRVVMVRTGKGLRASAQLQQRGEALPVFDDLAQIARAFQDRLSHE
ncbi:MAG TPA: HAD-IIIA family hydrolase [Steroidobacteraceae bacterium]|jgi:D-glycero-D-manno-heptose 1,7-bisphosphate phosphatase|nr:HAD-IIIA family hydrolase [Steroidobacteraceae bacterium]